MDYFLTLSQDTQLFIIISFAALIVMMFFSSTRALLFWIFNELIFDFMLWLIQKIFLWIGWFVKGIYSAHALLIKNIFTPRSVMLPSLDDQRHGRDK
ncbi:hypothetical protein BKE30_14725 [Alkanindiges hydrocarboniclasticus]|uniref:Uncharacterized protein n=1 Tax=Alkanindiges hydrocarboniclasticus TaxID=1907941 RepID=A0A1S8CR60_9GAMM|nr:hypothetical protein [Alkanindiges hydrocarboniclasticus]ONG37381.1 hypothetical protein BKE30_14725 [Alkanindiges hydrocarboniclasticus]